MSDAILRVRVKPNAARAGLLGMHGEALKVAVRAAPERGRANREVQEVVAAALGLPAAALELIAGAASPDKRWRVRGVTPADLARRIAAALEA